MVEQIGSFEIQAERRLCKVHSELGYFHCWEHYSKPVPAGLTIGSPPAGVISQVFGIVEFENGVKRCEPYSIKFCDEENANLYHMNRMKGETNTDG